MKSILTRFLFLIMCLSNLNVYALESIWFPIVYYTPETGAAGGVINILNIEKVKEGRLSNIQSVLAYTVKSQTIASITPKFYFMGGAHELSGTLFYSYYPNEYYGSGELHLDEPEKYTEVNYKNSISYAYNIYDHFFVRVGAGHDKVTFKDILEGGILETIYEDEETKEMSYSSFGIEYDSRDYANYPTQGLLYKISTSRYSENFKKYELDLKNYNQIEEDKILASQAYLASLDSEDVPLEYLIKIGGSKVMRGYYAGEYRNLNMAMLQLEYRMTINDQFGWALFTGASKLGPEAETVGGRKTNYNYGAGVNYLVDKSGRTRIKVDLGISQDNSGVYFVIGDAF